VRDHLAPGGKVALVVPDAEPFLEDGDVSILFHQHYPYFTAGSLASTLRDAGADGVRVRRSGLSKLLFATFGFGSGALDDVPFDRPLVDRIALAHRFRRSVARTTARLAAYFAEARALGESASVYVPGRFVNYVTLGGIPTAGLRFFDDSPMTKGKYFPGIDVAVEDQEGLVARPPSRVLVMSTSFGAKIKTRIAPLVPETRVVTLDELLRGDAR
jgi:hypothetical protein